MLPSTDKRQAHSLLASSLLSTALNSMVIRGLGPISSVVLTLLLARQFGAEITGMFYLLVTLQTCAAIIARFGFDTSLQRFAGAAAARKDWALVKGIYFQALALSTLFSLVLALAMSLSACWIADTVLHQVNQRPLIIWMSLTIVPFALAGLHALHVLAEAHLVLVDEELAHGHRVGGRLVSPDKPIPRVEPGRPRDATRPSKQHALRQSRGRP